jgi:hypothetical protein
MKLFDVNIFICQQFIGEKKMISYVYCETVQLEENVNMISVSNHVLVLFFHEKQGKEIRL